MLEQTLYNPEFWKHLSIPFVAALVGWSTNWVAIRLTFRPLEYVGLARPFGWQGIIPSKAAKMARIFVDRTMFRLGTLKELFEEMEPERIAEHISAVMDKRAILPALEGMMPCQPGKGRSPTYSSGLKVNLIAIQFVLQPTRAATNGMLRCFQNSGL